MNNLFQLIIALITLAAAGISAYRQVRTRRHQSPVPIAAHGPDVPARPTLNGFTEILREALDKLDMLRRENEQLKIRNAELEAQLAARPAVTRPRRKSAVGG